MAVKVGSGAAYREVKAPENDISQGLQYWGQMQQQQRQFEANAKEKKDIRTDEKFQEAAEKFGDTSALNIKGTGYKTIDQIGAEFTETQMRDYADTQREYMAAIQAGDYEKESQAKSKLLSIQGSFKQVGEMRDVIASTFEAYKKAGDKISGASADWERKMQTIVEGQAFSVKKDASGLPIIVLDDTGEEIKYEDLINGKFTPILRREVGEDTKTLLGSLGTYTEIKSKGLYKTTQTLWNADIEARAKEIVEKTYINNDDVMADLLNQFTNGESTTTTGFSQDERDLVSKSMVNLMRAGYEQVNKTEFEKDFANYAKGMAQVDATNKRTNAMLTIAKDNIAFKKWEAGEKFELKEKELELVKGAGAAGSSVRQGDPISVKVGNEYKNFTPYTSHEKDGQIRGIFVHGKADKNGKVAVKEAASVGLTKDKSMMYIKYTDGTTATLARNGSHPDVFQTVMNQITPQRGSSGPITSTSTNIFGEPEEEEEEVGDDEVNNIASESLQGVNIEDEE